MIHYETTIKEDKYTDYIKSKYDIQFTDRITKDIDMILIMEDNFPEFAAIFWEYIKEGGYKCGWKNAENMRLNLFFLTTVLISVKA